MARPQRHHLCKPGAGKWLDRLAGTVFIALGVKLIGSR